MAEPQHLDPNSARQKILAAASRLFWEKGFNGASVRDIAAAYGCKPANLYNFFPGKEAILYEVLVEEMERLVNPLLPILDDEDGDPLEQLKAIIRWHLAINLNTNRSSKILFDVALENLEPGHRKKIIGIRDDYDRVLRAVLRRGKEQGMFADLDEKLTGFMIASMITRCRLWFDPEDGASVDDLTEFIFRFTIQGIGLAVG